MAIITLRQSSAVTDPSATIKNSPLTNAEVDNNFANINISSGVLTSLNTEGKANLVVAINELSSNIFALDTDGISEGTNLYYTNVRAFANLLNATTTSLSEGTNLYFTNTRAIDTVEDTGLTMTGNISTPGLTISGTGNIGVGGGITTVGINSSAHVLGTNVYAAGGLTATGDLLVGGTSRFGGPLLTSGFFAEKANIISTGFNNTGANVYNIRDDGVVHYHTGDATANSNVHIYGIDQTMEVGNVISMAVLITQGASPKYVSGVRVGNVQANVVRWQGGVVPSSGTAASNIDVYVFNVIKTGAVDYTVIASQTQFGGTQG